MKKLIALIITIILVLLSLASCGSQMYNSVDGTKNEFGYDYDSGSYSGIPSEVFDEGDSFTKPGSDNNSSSVSTNRKVIEYITFNIQTKEYDKLISGIKNEISSLGGYIESSDISGGSLNETSSRRATLVVRIPTSKSSDFSEYISDNGTVTRKETSTEDVTLEYVDTESRIKALRSEKEALEKMLSEADTVENILTIRNHLSDVIYQIESYESRLRTMNDLIDFTTVTLHISEVERTVIVEKQTMWQRIGSNLKENFEDVGKGLEEFFIFLISSLPYLLVISVIAGIVLLIVFSSVKRSRKKREKLMEEMKKQNLIPPYQN